MLISYSPRVCSHDLRLEKQCVCFVNKRVGTHSSQVNTAHMSVSMLPGVCVFPFCVFLWLCVCFCVFTAAFSWTRSWNNPHLLSPPRSSDQYKYSGNLMHNVGHIVPLSEISHREQSAAALRSGLLHNTLRFIERFKRFFTVCEGLFETTH